MSEIVIVDVHTHLGEYPGHISEAFAQEARSAWGGEFPLGTDLEAHHSVARSVGKVVALGFCAPASGWVVPNDYVAEYVKQDPDVLVGFGSVDPTDPAAPDEVERMKSDLGLRGCKMGPIYQQADPLSEGFLIVCEMLERLQMPMLIHQGTTFVRRGHLIHARPVLVDELAIRFPELRIVIAHMGHPWIEETVAVIRKQPNVYADISALHPRPWQLYQALVCAVEYRAERKLLFGSDYPFFTAEETAAGLRRVNDIAIGTQLPEVPTDVIEGIIHRPTLELLGID